MQVTEVISLSLRSFITRCRTESPIGSTSTSSESMRLSRRGGEMSHRTPALHALKLSAGPLASEGF